MPRRVPVRLLIPPPTPRRSAIPSPTVIVLLMLAAAIFILPIAGHAGEIVNVDGVPHIRNAAEPPGGIETRQLEELWRAGGVDDDAVLGRITQVLGDDAGNVYLLDEQLAQVHVYSPTGVYERALSREGEGPGETRRPIGMVFMPDCRLGLLQAFPGKIVTVDFEGNPRGTIRIGTSSSMIMDAHCAGNDLIVGGIHLHQEPGFQDRRMFLAKIDDEGEEVVRYLSGLDRFDFDDFELNELKRYFVFWRWTADPAGRIFAATERNRYAISVLSPDGTVERVIERSFTLRPRDEEEIDAVRERFKDQVRNVPFPVRFVIEETHPAISGVRLAGDGTLWVLSVHGLLDQPDGIIRTYDVYDTEGHFTKQVALALPGARSEDRLFFAGEDRVIVIAEAPEEEDAGEEEAGEESTGAGGDNDPDAAAAESAGETAPPEVICYVISPA